MFGSRTTDPAQIPPCKDAYDKHIKRFNYQAAIWHHCLQANPPLPSPHGDGWIVDQGICIDWMDLPPAPQAILSHLSCNCHGKCSGGHCSCKLNGISCTGGCRCKKEDCENRPAQLHVLDDQLLSEDDADIK